MVEFDDIGCKAGVLKEDWKKNGLEAEWGAKIILCPLPGPMVQAGGREKSCHFRGSKRESSVGARSLLEQGGEEDLRKNLRMRVLLITKVKVLQKALEGFQGLESWGGGYTEAGMDLILGAEE